MHDHWICYNKLPNSSTNDPRIPLDIRLWIRGSFVLIICSSKGSHHYFIAIIFTPGRVLKKSPHPKEGVAIAFYLEIILVITGAKQNMPYIYIYFVSCAFIGIISSERMKFEFLYIYIDMQIIYIDIYIYCSENDSNMTAGICSHEIVGISVPILYHDYSITAGDMSWLISLMLPMMNIQWREIS